MSKAKVLNSINKLFTAGVLSFYSLIIYAIILL